MEKNCIAALFATCSYWLQTSILNLFGLSIAVLKAKQSSVKSTYTVYSYKTRWILVPLHLHYILNSDILSPLNPLLLEHYFGTPLLRDLNLPEATWQFNHPITGNPYVRSSCVITYV